MRDGIPIEQMKTLQSWKEIASYLGRGIRTVQRWEMAGLPVRRAQIGSKHNPVYAIAHELDGWLLGNPRGTTLRPRVADRVNGKGVPEGLKAVVVTDQLLLRRSRSTDSGIKAQVLNALGHEVSSPPEKLLGTLTRHALELCRAGSSGLSMLHPEDGGKLFHWDAMAGRMKDCAGQTTPRDFSPCGYTLERRSPQLFSYPERYFSYFADSPAQIVEGLVIPIFVEGRGIGTIWVVSHDESCKFNSDDVSVMTSLAAFCEAALSCSGQTPSTQVKQEVTQTAS